MTTQEFGRIAALIDNACKDDFDDGREAAYALVLSHLPAIDVYQAVLNLLGRPGPAWAPSTREIAAEVHAVQFIGSAEWARQRLAAVVSTLNGDDQWLVARGGHGRSFAAHLLAVHPDHGKRLLRLVHDVPLTLANHPNWWEHVGARQWDQLAFDALDAGDQTATDLQHHTS